LLRSSPFEGETVPCRHVDGERADALALLSEFPKITRGARRAKRPPHRGREFVETLTALAPADRPEHRLVASAENPPRQNTHRSAGKTKSKAFAPTWPLVQERST
jgi:hypothetical protein